MRIVIGLVLCALPSVAFAAAGNIEEIRNILDSTGKAIVCVEEYSAQLDDTLAQRVALIANGRRIKYGQMLSLTSNCDVNTRTVCVFIEKVTDPAAQSTPAGAPQKSGATSPR